jgi:hypothetical protein
MSMMMSLGVCSGSTEFTDVDGTRSAITHYSVACYGSSGYRGVAAMIGSAWVKRLTGTSLR